MADNPVPDLTRRLAALRGALRRLYALDGLSRLLLVTTGAAFATFLLDWSVHHFLGEELPRGARLVLLAAAVAACLWSTVRHLLYPLRRPITDDDLALCLERRFPALQDRLISAVQLARTLEDPSWRAFNSPVLVENVIAEAREATRRIDFHRLLVPRRVHRSALMAGAAALLGVLLAAAHPAEASIWIARLLGGDARWPRQTRLRLVDPPRVIARGDDCPVTVRAYGRIPDRATLLHRSDSGDTGSTRMDGFPITASPDGDYREFKAELSRVVEPFEFAVRSGDDETAWHRVEVRTAPGLESIVKWLRFPKHLPLTDTPEAAPEEGGNIKAPAGTTARLRIVSTEPLAEARLILASQPDKRERLAPEADPARPMRVFTGSLAVRTNDEYRIELAGENGLHNREPLRFSILAVPDAPPAVRVIEPGADRIATPDAVWPLQLETTDDYGIRSIRLVWWVIAQGAGPEQSIDFDYPAQNDGTYGGTRIASRHPFDLARTGAREREQVAYRFEARDFDEAKSKPTQTRTYHFTLWSRSDLEKREEETLNRIKEELRRIQESEIEIRGRAVALRDQLRVADALDVAQKAAIQSLALDQRRKIGQRLERVARDLQESARTIRYNRLLDPPSLEKIERLHALTAGAAQTKSPEASLALAEAGGARTPADRRARFDQGLAHVDAILADLRDALGLLEEWINYQEIVRRWREVQERQEGVNKAILEMLGAPR